MSDYQMTVNGLYERLAYLIGQDCGNLPVQAHLSVRHGAAIDAPIEGATKCNVLGEGAFVELYTSWIDASEVHDDCIPRVDIVDDDGKSDTDVDAEIVEPDDEPDFEADPTARHVERLGRRINDLDRAVAGRLNRINAQFDNLEERVDELEFVDDMAIRNLLAREADRTSYRRIIDYLIQKHEQTPEFLNDLKHREDIRRRAIGLPKTGEQIIQDDD